MLPIFEKPPAFALAQSAKFNANLTKVVWIHNKAKVIYYLKSKLTTPSTLGYPIYIYGR